MGLHVEDHHGFALEEGFKYNIEDDEDRIRRRKGVALYLFF